MNIYSWNVNGIRSTRLKRLSRTGSQDEARRALVQETRAEADQVPDSLRSPEGYFTYWNA